MNTATRYSPYIVILGAGDGTRMNDIPGGKLLASVNGATLLQQTLAVAANYAPRHPRLLVVNPRSSFTPQLVAIASMAQTGIVYSDLAVSGISASIAAGIQAARDRGASAVLLLLADDPLAAIDLRTVIDCMVESAHHASAPIAVKRSDGAPHPVCIPSELFDASLDACAASPDGLGAWLAAQPTNWVAPSRPTTQDIDQLSDIPALTQALNDMAQPPILPPGIVPG